MKRTSKQKVTNTTHEKNHVVHIHLNRDDSELAESQANLFLNLDKPNQDAVNRMKDTIDRSFIAVLKKRREAASPHLQETESRYCVDAVRAAQIESGKRKLMPEDVAVYANAFNMSEEELARQLFASALENIKTRCPKERILGPRTTSSH